MDLTRRTLLPLLATSAGALSLAGCGQNRDPNSITVLMEDISYTTNIRSLLPEFIRSTGIDVTIETVPYSDQVGRILQGFSQKSPYYDAVFTDNTYGRGFYDAKFVREISSWAAKDTRYGGLDEYVGPYISALTDEKGTVYGLPVYGESTFLMYRTDLFEQNGLEGPPASMQELDEAARAITEGSGGDTAGITLRGSAGIQAVYPWAGFLRAFGGRFVDDHGNLQITTKQAQQSVTFWAELLQKYGASGAANFDWEQNRIAFTQGRAAMTVDATANGPFNEDAKSSKIAGKVGYAPIPYAEGISPEGTNTTASLNVHAFYLSSFSEKSAATYRFIRWATSREVQAHAVQSVEAVGITDAQVLASPEYAERYGTFRDAMITQLENGNPDYLPGGVTANVVISEVGQALSSVLSGQEDAGPALRDAASNIRAQTM